MKKCIEIKGEEIDIRVNSDGVVDHNKNREVMGKVYQAAAHNHPNLRVAFDSQCYGHATVYYVEKP